MAEGSAPARTALVGNPSDGYGGAVLAVCLDELRANAVAVAAPRSRVAPASTLVDATVRRFAREYSTAGLATAVEWSTSIPHGVGLGGSSAIVIATARALCSLVGVQLGRDELAAFAHAVEREDLGIAGGCQDQVAESYGGLTLMNFSGGDHQQLDRALLPPLVVAWRADCSEHSGVVHAGLRERWDGGDRLVLSSIAELTKLAFEAHRALLDGSPDELARCVDQSFDLRARMLALDPRHVAIVECARSCGASANYSGSGGAIVAVCDDEARRELVMEALRGAGCSVLAPAFSALTPRA